MPAIQCFYYSNQYLACKAFFLPAVRPACALRFSPGTGYARISLHALPDRANTQMRLGTAIRALQISEKFQTVSRDEMQPRKAVSP